MVVKAQNLPRIGDQVVDENLRPVGIVFDVFGPISSPYVTVHPSVEEHSTSLVNKTLYTVPSSKPTFRREQRRK
jgi:RNA-binding protein